MSELWSKWFGRNRPPSASEQWGAQLPPTPLHQHLVSLHALLLHLGAEGDALAVGEHSLREIAVFTQRDPYRYP
jgi:hypothetical protein